MKKILSTLLSMLLLLSYISPAFAVAQVPAKAKLKSSVTKKQNISFAFVFDGPSDHNEKVLKQFQKSIAKSVASDYTAVYPEKQIYVGDWTEAGVKKVSDQALRSKAVVVISLGYLSSKYYSKLKNKPKFVITIDQYGLRDFGDGFFNPVHQAIERLESFKRITSFNKAAILINENYYKTRKDWNSFIATKLKDKSIKFTTISVNGDIDKVIKKLPSDVDAVFVTPIYNLSKDQREELFGRLNAKKIKTFSSMGEDDVQLGCLLGSSAYDLDRKLAEATSFNIQGVLKGNKYKSEKLHFYEDELIYINMDTAAAIGYVPPLRLLNSAEEISKKKVPQFNLSTIFDKLENQNIDIKRQKYLVKAAKKASLSANLKYLPTFGVTVGMQKYDEEFADSAKMSVPEKTGIFQMGIDQVLYSPALVTNILVKHKLTNFEKAEQTMVEQNMGIDIALLYIETLMLENTIRIQKEYVKESRENLAIARVRQKMGLCGNEEALRWASQLNINHQHLLDMQADLKNIKITISKLLNQPQNTPYNLAGIKLSDPAFYLRDLHVIDYVRTPQALETFTQYLVAEAVEVAPELAKLKAAIKIKNYQRNMYYQKFILPDAKLSLAYNSMFGREYTNPTTLPVQVLGAPGGTMLTLPKPNKTSGSLGIFAQWKPIEGGTKIAEIQRLELEKKELQAHMTEVKITLEEMIRQIVNRALAGYFSIERNHKAMFYAKENYLNVKDRYLKGKVPIAQLIDAQDTYLHSKLKAMNSQYVFFKELVWVQRAICNINWAKANPRAKDWIKKIKTEMKAMPDIRL